MNRKTEIQPFTFTGQPVRVITDERGEPWFVAADVAVILGYRMASDMTRRLDDDDRGTRSVRTPGGDQDVTVITEPGLYVAVLGSQVSGARDFKRWVTHEVLPTIRRTGGYTVTPAFAIPQTMGEALRLAADEHDRANAAEAQVAELESKADLADTFLIADGTSRLVREAAKLLGLRERDLRRFLVDEKLVFVRHTMCGQAQYDYYAEFSHHFTVKETPVEHTFGVCSHYTLRITARGIELIRKRMRDAADRRGELPVAVTA